LPRRSSARLTRRGVLFSVAIIAATLTVGVVRWTLDTAHANADVYYYATGALVLSGTPRATAEDQAAAFTFAMVHPGVAGTYQPDRLTISSDPRYTGIFRARALYPAIASALAPALGVGSLIGVAFLAAVIAVLAVGWTARAATGSDLAGAVAAAALLVSPAGRYLFWVLADGTMLAFLAICLAASSWYLRSGARVALASVAGGLVAIGATKIGNLDVVALGLMAVGVGGVVFGAAWRTRGIRLALISGCVLIAAVVGSAAVGLPSAMDQIQDLLTAHFQKPDSDNPIVQLLRADLHFFPGLAPFALGIAPLVAIGATIVAGVTLVKRSEEWVWPWVASAVASGLLIAIHPVRSELDRLVAPLWLSVAIGIGLVADVVARNRRGRAQPMPDPAAVGQ
jgi:hypothetical protein